MTPVNQQFRHNPPETYGDCHRASLASLLDLSIEEVPNFMHGLGPADGEIFQRLQDEFLRARGLESITVPIACELDQVFAAANNWCPGKMFLLGGEADRGVGHTVVAGADGVIHDPHPSKVGIHRPMSDGFYWITFIVGRL